MRKLLFLLPLLAVLFTTSCTVEEVDPDIASNITGTYTMDKWSINGDISTGSVLNIHKIIVTKEDDNTVSVELDFGSTYADLTDDGLTVTETSTGYSISREYSNGSINGTVEGDRISYTRNIGDDYYLFEGEK